MVTVFFPTEGEQTLRDLLPYLAFGSLVGSVFCRCDFLCKRVSLLPMIMHRDVDSITAIVTSINAVLRNKRAMLVWLTIIVASLLFGPCNSVCRAGRNHSGDRLRGLARLSRDH